MGVNYVPAGQQAISFPDEAGVVVRAVNRAVNEIDTSGYGQYKTAITVWAIELYGDASGIVSHS
jgi:hypothetical protein